MRNPYNLATVIMTDYADRVMYGEEAEDEALQNAIDWTCREFNDEWRSDLYAKVYSAWDKIELRFVVLEHAIIKAVHGG